MHTHRGFTLIELILVMIILGVVGLGITGFIRSSTQVFIDVTERERLLREGSFLVERLHRELANAIPNSVRVSGNAQVHCLEFVPIEWSGFYLQIPLRPTNNKVADIVKTQDIDGNWFQPQANIDVAIVYPTRHEDVYSDDSHKRQKITSCSSTNINGDEGNCATGDDADNVIQLGLTGAFSQFSPANRLYFANKAVSYCVSNSHVYRYIDIIKKTQTLHQNVGAVSAGGVLMAKNVSNILSVNPNKQVTGSQDPFRLVDPSLMRNAYTQVQLIFSREDESITLTQEVHIPNVP